MIHKAKDAKVQGDLADVGPAVAEVQSSTGSIAVERAAVLVVGPG